jgi:hypothetical protein
MSATLLLAAKLLNELGHGVEEVGNETDVGDLGASVLSYRENQRSCRSAPLNPPGR